MSAAARSLRVVTPVAITDAMLVSSSIAETDHTAWSNATAYTAGTRVRYVAADVHQIYECITDHTNKDPTAAANAAYWSLVGPTNRWGMFDLTSSSISESASTIDVELEPGLIDTVVIDAAVCTSARVRMTDVAHGTFYDRTVSMISRQVSNFTEFCFAPFRQRRTLMLADLPRVSDATVRVTLSGSGTLELGTLLAGRSTVIGDVQARARIQVIDYSRKDVDDFGRTVLVPRPSTRQMNLQILVPSYRIDEVVDVLDERRNVVSWWAVGADTGYRSLQMLGLPEFDGQIDGPLYSSVTGQIKGIT